MLDFGVWMSHHVLAQETHLDYISLDDMTPLFHSSGFYVNLILLAYKISLEKLRKKEREKGSPTADGQREQVQPYLCGM